MKVPGLCFSFFLYERWRNEEWGSHHKATSQAWQSNYKRAAYHVLTRTEFQQVLQINNDIGRSERPVQAVHFKHVEKPVWL